MDQRTEKRKDWQRHGWTARPYCATCGATSGQPHDPTKHETPMNAQPIDHEPRVTRMTSRHCGTCGRPIMFDPKTLRPWHVTDAMAAILKAIR